jgi:lipoyl-dependent peroxiredoxin
MPKRTAKARWEGKLKAGQGFLELGSGAFKGPYSFGSRFENAPGTNPEELIGAAHAGCFSMALSLQLEQAGYAPKEIVTHAEVQFQQTAEGFRITDILLSTEAAVPDIDAQTFQKQAESAKQNCPISKALSSGIAVKLKAVLKS